MTRNTSPAALLRRPLFTGVATRGGWLPANPGHAYEPGSSYASDDIVHASAAPDALHGGRGALFVITSTRGRVPRRDRPGRRDEQVSFLPNTWFICVHRSLERTHGWVVGLLDCGSPVDQPSGPRTPTQADITAAQQNVAPFTGNHHPRREMRDPARYLTPLQPRHSERDPHQLGRLVAFDPDADAKRTARMRVLLWASCRSTGTITLDDLRATRYRDGYLVTCDAPHPSASAYVLVGTVVVPRHPLIYTLDQTYNEASAAAACIAAAHRAAKRKILP